MASWRLAPCLDELFDEINAKWPNRSKSSDGALGDASHAARKSDHNPDSNGVVHAIDVTTTRSVQGRRIGRTVKRACIGDPRVWYVIWRGHIWSKTYGWKKRPYHGPSPHFDHVHISANYNSPLVMQRGSWRLDSVFARLFGKLRRSR